MYDDDMYQKNFDHYEKHFSAIVVESVTLPLSNFLTDLRKIRQDGGRIKIQGEHVVRMRAGFVVRPHRSLHHPDSSVQVHR